MVWQKVREAPPGRQAQKDIALAARRQSGQRCIRKINLRDRHLQLEQKI
jgi:hypothetical protein